MSKKSEVEAAVVAAPVDGEVQRVERAFAAGNFSAVRNVAATSSSPSAREAAER